MIGLLTLIAALVAAPPNPEPGLMPRPDEETLVLEDRAYDPILPVSELPLPEDIPVEPHSLIITVAETYRVPAGLVYGIWMKETRGMTEPWGTSSNWHHAGRLLSSKGRCVPRYGYAFCRDQWKALEYLCAQTDSEGRNVCERPRAVRASYAFAVGPMQHLPRGIVRVHAKRGFESWGDRAVDFDRDGTVDPLRLPDAFAMSATMLRREYERVREKWSDRYEAEKRKYRGKSAKYRDAKLRKFRAVQFHRAWSVAANEYFGTSKTGYAKDVRVYWREWCRMHKDTCDYGDYR